jgi:acyl-Coa thioesterase superfamily protein/acyl-CoA thioesterase superfamily protein
VHSVFFEPAGPDAFQATKSTIGPWSTDAQHGGPPSALAARVMEAYQRAEHQRLASVAVDILRPVPIGLLTTRTRIVRPGRRVTLLETVLESAGQEVLHARGWRLEKSFSPPSDTGDAAALPAIPAERSATPIEFPGAVTDGYVSAMDWRYVAGSQAEPGPAAAWLRPTIPLLPGEELSPMCRALLAADSGSGISAVLDPFRFIFLNVDLKVVLERDPAGEWLLLDAATTVGPAGSGQAVSTLSDRSGRCGRALQTLLVAPRDR